MRIGRTAAFGSRTRAARLGALGLLLLGGCASSTTVSTPTARHGTGLAARRWVLLPFMNYSDTPRADEGARSILATLLRARGVNVLAEIPAASTVEQPIPDLDGRLRLENALTWARKENYTVGLTGSVNEWRYRTSADGSPAAGLSLSLVDIATGEVLWSASGARSGSAGGTVSGTALGLAQELLGGLEVR